MNEIPTPETDAHMKTYPFQQWDYFDHQTQEKMCDFERRLTVAREALQAVSDAGGNYCDLLTSQEIAEKALEQTETKP